MFVLFQRWDTQLMEEILQQLRLVVYPIIYRVLLFYTSQLVQDFFHQQYVGSLVRMPQFVESAVRRPT